ncbi:MAG: DUF1501 domain-containing protein [Rhodobacter sp.]|nr:DUF1501 domain-containing protein [Rhodobacter sp.]
MQDRGISRRGLLRAGLIGACSVAAHPLLSTMTLAATPGDARLVVIILRGAMDGLDVVRPVGDPLLAGYRATLLGSAGEAIDLDGYFAMHPKLAGLHPLWQAGELGFAHAVSTPYRDKRSHFDGQDLLEAGTGMDVALAAQRGGWLNRLLQVVPGTSSETAFAIGNDDMNILGGSAPASRWSPEVDIDLTPQAELLLNHIYAPDPQFAPAAAQALKLASLIDQANLPKLANGDRREPLAAFAASRLNEATRIAAYSLTGWDTHQGQKNGIGRALNTLERSVLSLREGLGANWGKTLVLAMTEFGRTVAENGTHGTDHGTGGAMVMAGGALRGGHVYGQWPGLAEADLYQRRDLMPTMDVRAFAAWALRGLYGIDRATLEAEIFPGLTMGADPVILA